MRGCRSRLGWRLGAAMALLGGLPAPLAAQVPTYLRRLDLPVADDTIGYPRGVTADLHTGEVFVCDTRGNRVLIFDADGLFTFEIPGGDAFSAPMDVAVDPEGYLVLAANHQRRPALVELDFDGLFLREIVLSGLPEDVLEPRIHSVALSPSGDRLYAVDRVNLRIWIATRDGALVEAVDLAAELTERQRRDLILGHVDVYGDQLVLAVPSDARIRLFALDGDFRGEVGIRGGAPCTLLFPVAAAVAENGELLVVDQQRMVLMRWNPDANRCLGETLGLGAAPGFLYYPMDLALDRSGRIFVSQGYQGRVQMYRDMPPAAPLDTAR